VKGDLRLPVLELLPDGSCLSVAARPTVHDKARNKLIAAARAGDHHHRPAAASAQELARAYCQRWEEETGNDQLKTCLRGPGAVLRSKRPDMVRQEIYGYRLTHYAMAALICRAADPAFPP
jgi:hypothetical protein